MSSGRVFQTMSTEECRAIAEHPSISCTTDVNRAPVCDFVSVSRCLCLMVTNLQSCTVFASYDYDIVSVKISSCKYEDHQNVYVGHFREPFHVR